MPADEHVFETPGQTGFHALLRLVIAIAFASGLLSVLAALYRGSWIPTGRRLALRFRDFPSPQCTYVVRNGGTVTLPFHDILIINNSNYTNRLEKHLIRINA